MARYYLASGEHKMRVSSNHKQSSTHNPVLIKLIPQTTGDVCEVGAGFYSTPILHWLSQGRKFVTYENDPGYLHYAKKFQTNNHSIRTQKEIDYDRHWGVVFIDHSLRNDDGSRVEGRDRGDDVLRFKNADIFVLHDTEDPKYRYEQLWPKFKYVYHYKNAEPWTSVISNTVDVCTLMS